MRNVATNVPPPVPDRFGEIAVMIVDDHEVVRRGIAEVIDRSEGMSVVAEAGSVAEGIRRATLVRPQVVLVDLQLPDGTGIDVILALREQLPEARSVVLTSFDGADALAAAPTSRAAARASPSSQEVSTTERASGSCSRRARITSMPVPSGSCRSTSTTWGRTRVARRIPSATDPASATTLIPSERSITSAMPRRTTSWSSTIITAISPNRSGTGGGTFVATLRILENSADRRRQACRWWDGLTLRAPAGRPVHEALPQHLGAAARARPTCLPVDRKRPVEVSRGPVHVHVQAVEAGATREERLRHHPFGRVQHLRDPCASHAGRRCGAVHPRAPQGLVGVDVPHTGDQGLVQQGTLDPGPTTPQRRHQGGPVQVGVQQVAGDVRGGQRHRGEGAPQATGRAVSYTHLTLPTNREV